jgi:hypothetical protein
MVFVVLPKNIQGAFALQVVVSGMEELPMMG